MQLTSRDTLRALMGQRHMSLGTLSRSVGCNKSFVSHLLAGRRNSCTAELAVRIADALQVPLNILFVPPSSAEDGRNGYVQDVPVTA
jgi:hypothetical protein